MYRGGAGVRPPAILGEVGTEASSSGGGTPPILVKYTVTPTSERKKNRLYRRFTELEGIHPELLRKGANFITLTSKSVVTIEEGRLAVGRATQYLREHGYPFYVATTAMQPERARLRGEDVEHCHICGLGYRKMPLAHLLGLRKAWGLGATYQKIPRTILGVLNYLAYMNDNFGRLSWSYALLKLIPGGAAPHTSCWRYFKAAENFPGGVVNVGWGVREFDSHPGEVFVPALAKFVPKYSTISSWWLCKRIIEHREAIGAAADLLRSMAASHDVSAAIDREGFRFTHEELQRLRAAGLRHRAEKLEELSEEREAITCADES